MNSSALPLPSMLSGLFVPLQVRMIPYPSHPADASWSAAESAAVGGTIGYLRRRVEEAGGSPA